MTFNLSTSSLSHMNIVLNVLSIAIILSNAWLPLLLAINHYKSISLVSIHMKSYWKEFLKSQNAGVRRVMSWEGFVESHSLICFDDLRVTKLLIEYLNWGYWKLNNARTMYNGRLIVNTFQDVIYLFNWELKVAEYQNVTKQLILSVLELRSIFGITMIWKAIFFLSL